MANSSLKMITFNKAFFPVYLKIEIDINNES